MKIKLGQNTLSTQFLNLVKGVSKKGKPVVLLIDEYDKPIVDFIVEIDKAKSNLFVIATLSRNRFNINS